MNISLRHLTYFSALCEHGHFANAAEVCTVSQPALSVKIQELEEILAAPLIDRESRPYKPTPFGREILAKAKVVLSGVDDLHNLARMQRGLEGRFTLGVIPTVAPYILPAALGEIQKQIPKLDLRVREATTDVLLRELEDGKLDACIIATDTENPDMKEEILFRDRFLLAINSDEATSKGLHDRKFQLTDMTDLRLLLLSEGHCLRDQVQNICQFTSKETLNQIGASSLQTLIGLSAGGYGVTLVPEIALGEIRMHETLQLLRLADPEPNRHIRLVSKKRHGDHLELGALTEIFAKVGRALAGTAK